jgi:hypothetical protein
MSGDLRIARRTVASMAKTPSRPSGGAGEPARSVPYAIVMR